MTISGIQEFWKCFSLIFGIYCNYYPITLWLFFGFKTIKYIFKSPYFWHSDNNFKYNLKFLKKISASYTSWRNQAFKGKNNCVRNGEAKFSKTVWCCYCQFKLAHQSCIWDKMFGSQTTRGEIRSCESWTDRSSPHTDCNW